MYLCLFHFKGRSRVLGPSFYSRDIYFLKRYEVLFCGVPSSPSRVVVDVSRGAFFIIDWLID